MTNHNIAVIGAGISGLAASAFLKERGFDVTIFESFVEPRPIGAGLVLQPTGLAALANLGLDKQAIQLGARINHFQGKTFGGKTVFNLSYKKLSPDYFALGIHRHSIFQLLHEKIKSLDIPIINRFSASDIKNENNRYTLISKDNDRSENYDLIIDASGARSAIRDKYAKVQFNRPLPYGALWGVCEDERQHIGKIFCNKEFTRQNLVLA